MSIKEYIFDILIIPICFVLQSTLMKALSFGGVSANILIIVVASFGFRRGKKAGLIAGVFTGILVDIFFGSLLGLYALIYMYIGYFNGFFKRLFFKDELFLQVALVAGSDFLFNFAVYVLLFLLKGRFHLGFYMLHVFIPEMVYTIIVAIIVFMVASQFDRITHRMRSRESEIKIV